MHIFRAALIGVVATLVLCATQDAYALRMTVKRIIFEGSKRADVLTLVNDGTEEQTYRLSWRNMQMTADQPLKVLDEGTPFFGMQSANDMVVFAPRRVTVAPGSSQQVRLMLRKPKDLADGEYRSHLWVRPEVKPVAFDAAPDATARNVEIKMLAGVSFPVFVRQGNLNARGSLSDLRLSRQGGNFTLALTLNRQGNRSLYGDIDVLCAEKSIYQARGIAIYPELDARPLSFTFPAAAADAESCRDVRVTYTGDRDDPLYRGKIIAEAVTSLP